MIELETERLRLRQWQPRDVEPFLAYHADEEMARFLGGACDRPTAWRRLASIIGHWVLRGFGFWALEEKQGGALAGGAGLWMPEGWPELEVGYWLLREKQGRGYATEAVGAARDYAFETIGAKTLVSYIHPDNERSRRVAERLGAQYEKTIELLHHGPHCVFRYPAKHQA